MLDNQGPMTDIQPSARVYADSSFLLTPDLIKAVFLTQQEIGIIGKDADNPYHKSKYASLEHIWELIKPVLAKNLLTIIQLPIAREGFAGVKTLIIHPSGGFYAAELFLPIPEKGLGAQGVGSCISYARRYSLTAALGIVVGDEDDDGEAAEGRRANKPKGNSTTQKEAIQPTAKPGLADRKAAVLAYIRGAWKTDEKNVRSWVGRVIQREVDEQIRLKTEDELKLLEEEVEKLKAFDDGKMKSYLQAKGLV